MRITNAVHHVPRSGSNTWLERVASALGAQSRAGRHPLRSAIVRVTDSDALIESTFVEFDPGDPYQDRFTEVELTGARRKDHQDAIFAAVQIVPTGVRCEFGGYAGDACPATNLLAAAADIVVTHPNAVNASELNEMASNVLYVEGRSLDDFLLGRLALVPTRSNRIGTFVDRTGIHHLDDVVNTLNAARAVGGIDCGLYTVGAEEIGVRTEWTTMGCAAGTVRNPIAILDMVDHLLAQGIQAIGGVSVIHGVTAGEFSRYLSGDIPNPSGGVEAIITHLISKAFRVPTAHAPLPYYQDTRERGTHNPRAAAEFISTPHYLCVLKGLARAPRLVAIERLDHVAAHQISLNNVGAVVVPASCLGGIPALAAEFSDIPLIAVEDNHTLLDVTNDKMHMRNVIPVKSYAEAAGVVLALRNGISLESLRRPIVGARRVDAATSAIGVASGL
ncbi:MAG: DUF3326 domain-containing protein [Steroidobacteraceae bacterium]|jgi:hypothetical protein